MRNRVLPSGARSPVTQSPCWGGLGAGAAAHVEGWPSRLGSLSLAMLGGTGAFLRSLHFVAGRLEPSASGVVLLVFLKKEQLVFCFF